MRSPRIDALFDNQISNQDEEEKLSGLEDLEVDIPADEHMDMNTARIFKIDRRANSAIRKGKKKSQYLFCDSQE